MKDKRKTGITARRILCAVLMLILMLSLCSCAEILGELVPDDTSGGQRTDDTVATFETVKDPDTDTGGGTDGPDTQDTADTDTAAPVETPESRDTEPEPVIDEDGTYDDKESVALYIHTYGKLPKNYITKNEAEALGWPGGSLEPYAPGKCIGGSRFGNYEGLLPKAKGRQYYECDIDTLGARSRGAKRIIYSNDGLIFYTEDHYETFEQLY